jgi:hypothetical protein
LAEEDKDENNEEKKDESSSKSIGISKEILGNKVDIQGEEAEGSVKGVSATITGPGDAYVIQARLSRTDDGILISGQGNYTSGPLEGQLNATLSTDENYIPDPSTLSVGGGVKLSQEVSGILIELEGTMENGSLASLAGTIQGPEGAYYINASVVDSGDTYTITGEGAYATGPVQGAIKAQILTDKSFNVDPSSLNIGGQVNIEKELVGVTVKLAGTMEAGSMSSISGTIEGPEGAFIINAAITDNGGTYTITGSGSYLMGPLQGTLNAEIQTDSSFNIDPSTLNIGGDVSLSKEIAGNQIDLSGKLESGSLSSLLGTIQGPNQSYMISASVVDNGGSYTITGEGAFSAGPIQGSLNAQIDTDAAFNIDPSSLNIGGDAAVNTELAGFIINLTGAVEEGSLKSLSGTVEGPGGSFLINVSVVDNGGTYTISGAGAFALGPVQGNLNAQIEADSAFNIDPSSLNIGGDAKVDTELMGIKIDMSGTVENGSLASLTGVIVGPDDFFTINAAAEKDGEQYKISGAGAFTAGPLKGNLNAEILTDSAFNIDPSSFDIGGDVALSEEIAGNQIDLAGTVAGGSLSSLFGTVKGPAQSYTINASVLDNGGGYTIAGDGAFSAGPIQGSVNAQIDTDVAFNIDPSSLNIGGDATVDTEIAGIKINLAGTVEDGSLKSLVGVVEGPNGVFLINVSVIDNGGTYTISGAGAFAVGPVQGNLNAQIEADSAFNIDPNSLNIGGDATVDTELMGIKINMTGTVENGSLASLVGVIVGPNDFFTINSSVEKNGEQYKIIGDGTFTAGPVVGNVHGEILTDQSFTPDMDSAILSGDATVDTQLAANQINMAGAMEAGSLQSLEGTINGPNGMYLLTAAVTDNGDSYTIEGGGAFTAGPIEGNVEGQIQTDKNFNPNLDSLQISGDATVDTDLAGNHILMAGTMENGSLQSLVGTIEGPNGLYMLSVSVVNNGDGYTITGGGNFAVGPVEGTVTGEIGTDANFNPQFDTLNVSGEANVDTETAGHHIVMKGVMVNGSLVSLAGTVEGPNGLYVINASVEDNGAGYTITGEGSFANGPIQGSVHGTINTDPNFAPDFSSLNMGGQAGIDTEVAGNKVNVSAAVNNGYLENIAGTVEGPGGLYEINAKGTREGDKGYDVEAGGAFTFFEEKFAFEPPAIMLPAGVPGVFIEVSTQIAFGAKASADMVTGFKTDPHFMPDFSTFEIRSATLVGHGEVSIDLFGGISVGLSFAKVSAGLKAQLKGVIDAMLNLTADSKGIKVSGSLYAALLGALFAAVKLKFLFFKKEFDFKIVEGKVASLEKEFGPVDFTLENILKGFQFGADDISIPGKDMKAKPPDPKETSGDSEKELEDAKSEDDDSKKEEENSDSNAVQGKFKGVSNGASSSQPVQKKSDGGDLPTNLKTGVEKLSGQDMSDVTVHKNSDKPAQLNAHAYAQGTDIHLGPGQEKHLPHEAWHVAQQKQGRVEPTKQFKGDVQINDDEGLEKEADEMGKKAEEEGNDTKNTAGAAAFDVENTGVDSQVPQLKAVASSSLKTVQNAADGSSNVSQLMEIDTLANKRDKSGIKQLQGLANGSKASNSPLQRFGSSPNETASLSETESQGIQENESDVSAESIEI